MAWASAWRCRLPGSCRPAASRPTFTTPPTSSPSTRPRWRRLPRGLVEGLEVGGVVNVEDHSEVGGLASIVAEFAGRRRLGIALRAVALPDADLEVGMPADLYEYYGLTVAGVVAAALELVKSASAEGSRPLQTQAVRGTANTWSEAWHS